MGYHYPRSLSTAVKSAHYFNRFMEDYSFSVLTQFQQIYATSQAFSWTNAEQFRKFCSDAQIPCRDVNPSDYFQPGMCDGAFLTKEYTYDAALLKQHLLRQLAERPNVEIWYGCHIRQIKQTASHFQIILEDGRTVETDFLLNATYASTNQISHMLGYEKFQIKYELCEIILCRVDEKLKGLGLTVMDGPFFSIMPFGKTGYHSLTSVTFTPHITSYQELPTFSCQKSCPDYCTPELLGNCNTCPARPASAWPYMSNLAKKYLREDYEFQYVKSLFSVKPILKSSEIDDSRPTVLRQYSKHPTYISVLSGKINTVYDLDEVLSDENE